MITARTSFIRTTDTFHYNLKCLLFGRIEEKTY